MAAADTGLRYACVSPHPPIIVHEVGQGRERDTQRTIDSLQQVAAELASHRPETVLILSPHGPIRYEAMGVLTTPTASGDFSEWGAPSVEFSFENDAEAVSLLQEEASAAGLPLTPIDRWSLDWGCTVPLYYLREGMADARLVPMTISFLSAKEHYAFGRAVARALSRLGRRSAIICSADLSHALKPGAPNGYHPAGPEFDERFCRAVADWDVDWVLSADIDLRRNAAEDAVPQMSLLMGALSDYKVQARVLSYEGPFGVGYMVAAIDIEGEVPESLRSAAGVAALAPEPEREPELSLASAGDAHPLLRLARAAVENYVRFRARTAPLDLPAELSRPAGVFVSIKNQGQLRGCIGTIDPTQANLALEVVSNAIGSASRDPRFRPIEEEELPDLTYSVDVLTPPEPIDGPEALDPRRYGVIVQSGPYRGLLLPDLEGVDTVEEQLSIACAKAGISCGPSGLPEEPVQLYRFEVKRYS
jgi:AmmeMemoRadiSam system protein A/AmmeMemoRadiSam system protein B